MDEAAAAVAAHLGVIDEDAINNMAYVWFNSVLEALGKRINFESISALYGNSFAKDASKVIQSANPLVKHGQGNSMGILGLFGKTKIISATQNKDVAKKAVENSLGDISWADGLF